MYRLKYRIKATSSLIISTISGDMNMKNSEKHIPGTAVQGVLANRFIQKEKEQIKSGCAHENDDFYNLFLTGGVKVCNAFIISQDEYGEYAYYPTPFSIEQEKYGLDTYDWLWSDPKNGEHTETVGNFCRLEDDTVWIKSVQTNINFHHARDPKRGAPKMVVDKGIIFNYESINSDQIFEGDLVGKENDLQRLVQICGLKWPAFVGRSRNSQYGAVEFNIINEKPEAIHSQITWPNDEDENPTDQISMTLISNLILYNENGYPTLEVTELENELKKQIGEVKIEKAFVKKTEIENFVGIWQLKKPSETCFAAGSTFLLKISHDNIEQLEALQQNGIGERTHEGFGMLMFAKQNQQTLFLRNEEEADRKHAKPKDPIPEITKKSITTIAKEIIIEKIELDAINKQSDFDKLPSRALVSRVESITKTAENREELIGQIGKFRRIAKDQLEGCVCWEESLYEFLTTFDPANLEGFFSKPQNVEIKSLCEEIDFKPGNDVAFTREIMNRYFATFFSMMRKRAISESEENNG